MEIFSTVSNRLDLFWLQKLISCRGTSCDYFLNGNLDIHSAVPDMF